MSTTYLTWNFDISLMMERARTRTNVPKGEMCIRKGILDTYGILSITRYNISRWTALCMNCNISRTQSMQRNHHRSIRFHPVRIKYDQDTCTRTHRTLFLSFFFCNRVGLFFLTSVVHAVIVLEFRRELDFRRWRNSYSLSFTSIGRRVVFSVTVPTRDSTTSEYSRVFRAAFECDEGGGGLSISCTLILGEEGRIPFWLRRWRKTIVNLNLSLILVAKVSPLPAPPARYRFYENDYFSFLFRDRRTQRWLYYAKCNVTTHLCYRFYLLTVVVFK